MHQPDHRYQYLMNQLKGCAVPDPEAKQVELTHLMNRRDTDIHNVHHMMVNKLITDLFIQRDRVVAYIATVVAGCPLKYLTGRLTRVVFTDRPGVEEFYLDWKDEEHRGFLLAEIVFMLPTYSSGPESGSQMKLSFVVNSQYSQQLPEGLADATGPEGIDIDGQLARLIDDLLDVAARAAMPSCSPVSWYSNATSSKRIELPDPGFFDKGK